MFEKYLTKTGRLSTKQPQEVKNAWYIQKFQEIHGNKYDYSKVVYTNSRTKIEVICKNHGSFFQTPSHHLQGRGCPACQGNNTKTTEECVQEFTQLHGDTYDYSGVQYVNNVVKVEIICKEHGSFLQRPSDHLMGHGCPKCQNRNQDTLYILKCNKTDLIKIGITNKLYKRISSIGGNLQLIYRITTEDPRTLENYLHEKYKDYNVFNPTVKSGGTEFFKLTDQQVQELIHELTRSD